MGKTAFKTLDGPIRLDDIAPLGRLGLLALATDYNSEHDLRRMLPDGVELFTNRVTNSNPMTLDNLRAMAGDITRAAAGILPGLGADSIIYGCTSGTAAIGADEVARRVHAALPGIAVTNPLDAAVAAIKAMGGKRISVLTPYVEEINRELAASFAVRGIEVLNMAGFAFDSDIEATGIPVNLLRDNAIGAAADAADVVFISCTALRASLALDEIEAALGKPAISSNQALAWHAMQLLGRGRPVPGYGRLLSGPI